MLDPITHAAQPAGKPIQWARRYHQVAKRQRQSAEQAILPRVREQLLRSAEKWDFLADSFDAEMELA